MRKPICLQSWCNMEVHWLAFVCPLGTSFPSLPIFVLCFHLLIIFLFLSHFGTHFPPGIFLFLQRDIYYLFTDNVKHDSSLVLYSCCILWYMSSCFNVSGLIASRSAWESGYIPTSITASFSLVYVPQIYQRHSFILFSRPSDLEVPILQLWWNILFSLLYPF